MNIHPFNLKSLWIILVLSVMVGTAWATPENAQLSGKECLYCHPEGPPSLGQAGLYFAENRNLDGYEGPGAPGESSAPAGEGAATADDAEEFHEEIGVHLDQWNVAIICFLSLLLVIGAVYASGI